MARTYSVKEAADRIRKWADVGVDYTMVASGLKAMDVDRRESQGRSPKLSGALAGTIRVIRPSTTRAKLTGVIRMGLSAGSRSSANPVPYASVLQRGLVGYPAKPKTRPHRIEPRGSSWKARFIPGQGYVATRGRGTRVLYFEAGGDAVFARAVQHPGSRFPAKNYLQINEPRAQATLDSDVERGGLLWFG